MGKMTTNLQTSVEYLRGLDWKNIESFDFLQHMGNVTRACLAENDPTPIEKGWPDAESFEAANPLMPSVIIKFELKQGVFYVWGKGTEGGLALVAVLVTMGEFRTFCRLFKIEVKA